MDSVLSGERPPEPLDTPETLPLGLASALKIVGQHAREEAKNREVLRVGLACGFTPIHAMSLLSAYLIIAKPDQRIEVVDGTYGDVTASLGLLADAELDGVVCLLDWPDLDPRLSLRSSSAGGVRLDDLILTATDRVHRIEQAVIALAERTKVVIALPATPMPPMTAARHGQQSQAASRLHALTHDLAADLAAHRHIRLLNEVGGAAALRDVRADFRYGSPLPVAALSTLTRAAVALLFPPSALKGLITDLDDTLWRGLVGETGANAVTWNLDAGSQVHAVYQRLLADLAVDGVLLAVVSKNDPDVADAALNRSDLLIPRDRFFPVLVSWEAKSAAVTEILHAWNLGATDVVVVDDNPRELAEVAAVHPGVRTREFPTEDPDAAVALFAELRALFWRDSTSEDDALRLDSIRASAAVESERRATADPTQFLQDLRATITIDLGEGWQDARALDLVNKTNQFNLNGVRHDERSWHDIGTAPAAVTATVKYEDRFGPLGTVAVLGGGVVDRTLVVTTWVLSCRAFSRQVEHHMLAWLCSRLDVDRLRFNYLPTPRNQPTARFLDSIGAHMPGWTVPAAALSGLTLIHRITLAS